MNVFETAQCPNCKTQLPMGATYCAKCGYGTKDGKPRRVIFPWLLVAAMFFVVPIAIFGGCLILSPSIDNSKDNTINIALTLELASLGIGVLMIITNIVMIVIRSRK